MDRTHETRSSILICLLLVGATLAVFWPVLHQNFLNYDDVQYVTENPHVVSGLTWQSVHWALGAGHASNWHPLTWISHIADVELFGLRPGWHHLTNLVFHCLNGVVLFLLLKYMTGALWRSALVSALFALHPLHVESVAWVAERKDVLSAFFFFLTLWAYARYARCSPPAVQPLGVSAKAVVRSKKPEMRVTSYSWPFYVLSLLCFSLGLMSKPMLVTVPFVLLLLDYWPLGRLALESHPSPIKNLLLEKLPFFALSAGSCFITMRVQSDAMVNPEGLPLGYRLGNAAMTCLTYLRQMVWPTHLAVFYPYPLHLPAATTVGSTAVVLLAATLAVLMVARRHPYAPVGWLWYLGMLVPVIGLVQVGSQARADRYTYLPSIGIFILGSWAIGTMLNARARASRLPLLRATLASAACVGVVSLGLAAHRQVLYWRDSGTLFAHAAAVTKDNYVAFTQLGVEDLRRGKYSEAMTNLVRALDLARSHGADNSVKYYLGAAWQMQGKPSEALPYLQEAAVGPDLMAERNCRLGMCLLDAGRVTEAEVAIRQALEAKPYSPDFQMAMAMLLQRQGQTAKAEQSFRELVETHPQVANVHTAFADFLVQTGRSAEAEVEYRAAIQLQTPNVALLRSYAATLSQQAKVKEAIQELERALELEPTHPLVNFELAELLSQEGRNREAIARYETALQADPKLVRALNNLAWVLATDSDERVRNGPRAIQLAQRACELTEWKAPLLVGTLAAAQAEAGHFAEAIAMAEKARDLARTANQPEVAKRNEELLQLYRAGKPVREEK
ncbi:putative Tetratricopeptide TPR_2 repeat protein [Verrucomicrobia bacterium]|nr:putative Tetratricopeptide TPR_2 repeat protein [Verrucomicrobiota bacterium]